MVLCGNIILHDLDSLFLFIFQLCEKYYTLSELEGIIDAAITKMPADYMINPFLEEHRAEVKGMLLTEYDEVATMKEA